MTSKLDDIIIEANSDNDSGFIPLIADGEDFFELEEVEVENITILALRNMVLFPGVVMPVSVGRKKSLVAIRNAYKKGKHLGVFTQKDTKIENPQFDDLYHIGVVAQIIKILEMPDGTTTAILQGKKRVTLNSITKDTPFLRGSVTTIEDIQPSKEDKKEFNALLEALKESAMKIIKSSGTVPPEANLERMWN